MKTKDRINKIKRKFCHSIMFNYPRLKNVKIEYTNIDKLASMSTTCSQWTNLQHTEMIQFFTENPTFCQWESKFSFTSKICVSLD